MRRMISIIICTLLFFSSIGCAESIPQLKCDTWEDCKKRSCILETKIQRQLFFKSCLQLISAGIVAWYGWQFFMSEFFEDASIKTLDNKKFLELVGVGSHLQDSPWYIKAGVQSGISLLGICAQHVCAQWIVSKMVPDFSVKSFIKKEIQYTENRVEIRSCLTLLPQAKSELERLRLRLIINRHMQTIVNKLQQCMAYALAQSRLLSTDIPYDEIEHCMVLTLSEISSELDMYNTCTEDSYIHTVDAMLNRVSIVFDSCIKYVLCVLPQYTV